MKKQMKKFLTILLAGLMTVSTASIFTACKPSDDTQAKNVILLIGDGMGPEQIKAGELFKGEALTMQGFPYMTKVETRSASDAVTDSAAAATAIATGTRTANGMIGLDIEDNQLETIVDIAHSLGKRTGIIATEELNGATPMGFSAHADNRGQALALIESAAESSNVDLFAGSVLNTSYLRLFREFGYEKITNADDISESTADKIIGSYIIPATYEAMTTKGAYVAFDRLVTEALEFLSKDEDGFFLMAEGSHIDHGGHNKDFCYMLEELIAFDNMVGAVLEWAKDRDDTVVIVTADHETGGLMLANDITHEDVVAAYDANGDSSCYSWTVEGHTSVDVNLYVNGANIDFSKYSFGTKDRIKNTDIFEIMKGLMLGQ